MLIALVSAAMASPGQATAHDGITRLLTSPDHVNPGGTVDVRGEDLPADSAVTLSLADDDGRRLELGIGEADGEGHLLATLVIPSDLPAGSYLLEATVDGIEPLSATVVVQGAPIDADGEPGPKDEDDSLLIALPSDWQRSLSGPVVTARPLTETLPAGSAGRVGTPWAMAVLVIGIAVMGAVALGAVGRRRARASRE
jgi:hypothetical protein